MATLAFNRLFHKNVADEIWKCEYSTIYDNALKKGAMFDARCFNIPKEEVTNCIYWRQLDASRNSIQMVGQANFSHEELQNKSCNEIQDMLMIQKGINWNDLPTYQKRGSCVVREEYWVDKNTDEELSKEYSVILNRVGGSDDANKRSRWIIDENIPIFKGEGREYIDKLICVGEE